MASENIVLMDPKTFAEAVPHEYYAELRATAPVALREEPDTTPYWAVMTYDACVTVNREWEEFSSYEKTALPFDVPQEEIEQQRLMMLNMDPPLHTRYRRLVNKAFSIGKLPGSVRLPCKLHQPLLGFAHDPTGIISIPCLGVVKTTGVAPAIVHKE